MLKHIFTRIRRKNFDKIYNFFKVVFLCSLLELSTANEKSLYKAGENILELDINNFNSTVYNKPTAFLVEFYSSWCGHCIDYAPHFVKFAKLVKKWKHVMIVAAVNCADEANAPVCREHEIDAFPTLRYFKANSKDKTDSTKFIEDKKDMVVLSTTLASYAKLDYDTRHPLTWPKLELGASTATLNDLWASTSPQASFLCIVVENEPTNNGYSMLINYATDIRAKLVVVLSSHPVATQFGGVQLPALLVFHRQKPQEVIYSSNSKITWIEMKEELDSLLVKKPAKQLTSLQELPIHERVLLKNEWNQFEVQYLDMTTALLYMLTQEVPRKSAISEKELSALKNWMHLLRNYFPGSAPIKRLFYRLDDWVKLQQVAIPAEKWLIQVELFQNELGHPLPSNSSYLACRGSKPYLRGYTCGLWTIMHAVTVQAYKEEKSNPSFKPVDDVLEPIHQFIVQFLSCEVCAKNFDEMTQNNELSKATKPEDVVLWLWRAHNNVNKRLAGENSEDPKFPKQQFPPSKLCSNCASDGIFDEHRTLAFLVQYYSDIKTDNVRPSSAYQIKEFANGRLEKVANKHLNPKFAAVAGKVDNLEEIETRIQIQEGGPKRQWKNIEADSYEGSSGILESSTADRKTFYLIWLVVIGLALVFAYFKYRQNRSKFWKTFYYHDYKLKDWCRSQQAGSRKYSA